MISEPLVLEGDLEIDHGCFWIRTETTVVDLSEEFKAYFIQSPYMDGEIPEDIRESRLPPKQAQHAGPMRIMFEPQDDQGTPLRLEGECGIDMGEIYVEGLVSGFIYTIFLRHFQNGPDDEEDEKDYQAEIGRFRVIFEPMTSGQ